jgi:hypothetical protein
MGFFDWVPWSAAGKQRRLAAKVQARKLADQDALARLEKVVLSDSAREKLLSDTIKEAKKALNNTPLPNFEEVDKAAHRLASILREKRYVDRAELVEFRKFKDKNGQLHKIIQDRLNEKKAA